MEPWAAWTTSWASLGGPFLGLAYGQDLAGPAPSTEEPIAAVGLESRNVHPRRHLQALQDLARPRIDPPQLALVPFPGRVPELPVHPGDAGDEAAGLDGAKNRPRL